MLRICNTFPKAFKGKTLGIPVNPCFLSLLLFINGCSLVKGVLRRKKQRKKVEDCHLHYPTAKLRPWADDPKVTLDYHSLFFLRGECLSILSTAN